MTGLRKIAADPALCADLVRRHNEGMRERSSHQPAAFVRTFGCQQNVSDSEKIKGMLVQMGYQMAQTPEEADLILFNTCAVRENAEDRIFGNVGILKHQKAANKDLIIGLCGCMMQQGHIVDKIRKHYPYVDLVFGTHALPRLPELIWQKLSEGGHVTDIDDSDGEIHEELPTRRDGTLKAWVPIMYGCNNFCTYCVVPYVRGRERSREPQHILDEISELIAKGYKEFTLLGQNVNSYGKTLDNPVTFAQLLEAINALPGKFRIRFMTSHPKDCTRELIDAIARCEKVCRHIHLPVQSGSDRILKAMNRSYATGQYLELIDYARERIPGVTFTSDIIVGFPGEQPEDFEDTLALVRRVRYQSLFTFLYSRRVGTKAAELPDDTPDKEKMRRFQCLLDTQKHIGEQHFQALCGETLEVLVDGLGKTGEGMLTGRSEQNIIVEFPGDESLIGQFAQVRIERALSWALIGEAAEV